MEENSHQKLLRRQLSESLDLNESLTARIEQLKAYIWRAGLEVPRPEDGLHGPIVEREQSVPHIPTKRLRTGTAGPELSDSVPLSFLEASLDRSVRLAFARSRDASRIDLPEDIPSDPLRLANSSSAHAEHSQSAKEDSERSPQDQVGESSKIPRGSGEDSEFVEPTPNANQEHVVEPAHEQNDEYVGVEPQAALGDDAGAVYEGSKHSIQSVTEATEKPDVSLNGEGERSQISQPSISSSNPLPAASFRHEPVSPFRAQPVAPYSAQSGYSEHGYWLGSTDSNSERDTGNLKLNSDTSQPPVQNPESPQRQPELRSPEVRANRSRSDLELQQPQEDSEPPQQPHEEDQEPSQKHRDESSESPGKLNAKESHLSLVEEVAEEEQAPQSQDPSSSSVPGVSLPWDNEFAHNHSNADVSRSDDPPSNGPSNEDQLEVVEDQNDESVKAAEESRAIPEANEAPEPRSAHEQRVSSEVNASAQEAPSNAPKRPRSPDNEHLDSLGAKVRAEVRANRSAPLLSRPPNTETLTAPNLERSRLAPRTGQRLSEPPLRKPRDDWAKQFRESFSSRKARGALERAGINATPSLTDSMRRIAEAEKGSIDERNRESLESRLGSDGSDDDLPQSVQPPTVELRRPDSSSKALAPNRTESSTSTITPVRAAGRRSSRDVSPNVSSSPINDSQRRLDPKQQPASVDGSTRSFVPKETPPPMPPLPRSLSRESSQQSTSIPLPAVPQSILKRLSKKIPGSVAGKASSPRSDQLASPFRGSVRPPMTSTPATKAKDRSSLAQTASPAAKSSSRELQDTSANSSVYQSALQSLEMSPRRSREQSDSPSFLMRGEANKPRPRDSLHSQLPQFVPQPVQPIANSSPGPMSPHKQSQRAPASSVPSAAAEERGSVKNLTPKSFQMADIPSSTAAGNRRVSFKLPSSSESNPVSVPDSSKPKPRRRLVRNVYPVDLSNTSQSSFPDMSMQAAADVGDISEHRERPPLNSSGGK